MLDLTYVLNRLGAVAGYPEQKALDAAVARITSGVEGQGPWSTFNPGLQQGVTIATSTLQTGYQKVSRRVTGEMHAVFNGAGTAAQQLILTAPVTPRLNGNVKTAGQFTFADVSAGVYYSGSVVFTGAGSVMGLIVSGATDRFGTNPAVTVAAGDILSVKFQYESAA